MSSDRQSSRWYAAPRTILAATGFRTTAQLLAAAAIIAALLHSDTIDHLGPLTFWPPIPVILLLPLLLAVGCANAHAPWPSPVITRSGRILAARALSYLLSFALASAIVGLLAVTANDDDLTAGTMRNLLWMSGIALITTAIADAAYSWLPLVVTIGIGILSPPSNTMFSAYAWLLSTPPTAIQWWISATLCAVGLTAVISDPRSVGYLRRTRT